MPALLGRSQNSQGSEVHVQCQKCWCQKQPNLISILKLPLCLMPKGSAPTRHAAVGQTRAAGTALPPTQSAQLTQASVSKANPGYCCLATTMPPCQPGLLGPPALPLLSLTSSQRCQHPWLPASKTQSHWHTACPRGSGMWLSSANSASKQSGDIISVALSVLLRQYLPLALKTMANSRLVILWAWISACSWEQDLSIGLLGFPSRALHLGFFFRIS